jgi:glycosyltransferase involved in cell wall biosynthesis
MKPIELTILMPCLNEEETIEKCVLQAKQFLENNHILGEVLVVDNLSVDHSAEIAKKCGARVIKETKRGYGNALICGNKNAKGKYIIMGDADCSYDFSSIMPFLELLRGDYDLVVGNRFKGNIEKEAMSFSHKYIGNPILSFVGKKLFKISIGDFHCGLRGYQKEKILSLNLSSPGMEYASEMIIRAKINQLKMTEVPIVLYKDGRIESTSHLNTIKDGIAHLKLMLSIYRRNKKI